MSRPQYTPWQVRHGSQDIPVLRPITVKVADLSDASVFPNIAAARAILRHCNDCDYVTTATDEFICPDPLCRGAVG